MSEHSRRSRASRHSRQSGFTLLEVLVALVVLSIGLIAQAGFQITSLRNVHSSEKRSAASWLASEIVDRMRVNEVVARNGAYDLSKGSAGSSTDPIASADLQAWKLKLKANLLDGDAEIVTNTNTGLVTVTVIWNDERGSGGKKAQELKYQGYVLGDAVK